MTWQIAIAISILANVVAILVQRRYAQKSSVPPTYPPAVSYLFGVMPVGIVAGLFILPHDIQWSWWLGLLLVIEGVSMALANWTSFIVSKHFSVAQLQTITRIYAIIVVILGWVVLDETLTTFQLIGASILFAGALVAIQAPLKKTNHTEKKIHLKYVLIAIAGAGALAVGLVTEKAIAGHMEVGGVFLVGWAAQTLAMILLAGKDAQPHNIKKLSRYELTRSASMGMLYGITGAFYVYAFVHADNISLVTMLTSIVLPLSVLAAYLFLHEKENNKLMWLSIAISFAGLLVMAL